MTKDFYLKPGHQDALKEKYENGLPWIRKPIIRLTCQVCGKTFYKPGETPIRYCSPECEASAARDRRNARADRLGERSCAVCGVPFSPKRKDSMYCGSACKQKAYRERMSEPTILPNAKR